MKSDLEGEWPKRYSLLDRAALTFKSFLVRDFGTRFYQGKFLDGIAAQRFEISNRVSRAASSSFVLTTILAFFDQVTGTISFSALTIKVSEDLVPIVAFLTSASVLAASKWLL